MSSLRPILILAVIFGACFISSTYSEHHHGSNDKAFESLYMHLMPAWLVTTNHAPDGVDDGEHEAAQHPLVQIPLPTALSLFDSNQDESDGNHLVMFNLQVFQLAAVLLIFIAFSGVSRHMKDGKGDAITRFLAGACLFVRNDMVRPNMQRAHADALLPMFLSLFFFILFMNLMGLVPGSVTPTACIFVTGALAFIVLGMMIVGGMVVQGPIAYWKSLVPHVPLWLWPLLFVVELIGVTVKPFALTIRLFANMTGGHMVVLSFMGLIFFFAGVDFSSTGYGFSPVAVGFAVFIMIIEGFVAFVQAYIFTLLSAIFVGASLHPEH